jgi:Rrf2 family protein
MKMSTKGRYGLRAMVSLAGHYGDGPVPVDTIAEEQDLSPSYAHVLLGSLKSARLVRSVRGPNGGYELTRKPTEITAYDVVTVLEGETKLVECVGHPGDCDRSSACATRSLWCQVAASVNDVLKSTTLATLAENQHANPTDYCI